MKTRDMTAEEFAAFRKDMDAIPHHNDCPSSMTRLEYVAFFNKHHNDVCRKHKVRFNIYKQTIQRIIDEQAE